MGDMTLEASDFGAGMWRGREAPSGAAYDLLNALIDDEGQPFLRGKTAYFTSADAGTPLTGLADLSLGAGRRLMAWGPTVGTRLYALDEGAGSFVSATGPIGPRPVPGSRAVQLGPTAVWQRQITPPGELLHYGGSLKGASYSTGSVTTTAGSRTVTGSGTAWLANVDAGMWFTGPGVHRGLVAKVDSDTQLTLREPYPQSAAGGAYTLATYLSQTAPASAVALGVSGVIPAAVGVPPRLVACYGHRAYFSEPGETALSEDVYHELPASEVIIGADSIEDTLLLFTTGGVWAVTNMALDPVDGAGNIQHQVAEISRSVILWGDPGIAAWEGVFVVPAVDDVYLFGASNSFGVKAEIRPISESIRPLYRSYVKAGYQPGIATVHRGHYFLPIINGSTLVDVLVCRLDRPYGETAIRPWTRLAGHAANPAYAQRVGSTTRSPQLLGVNGQRVLDLTGCMDLTSAGGQDADSTTPTFRVDTNDFRLSGGTRVGTAEKVRAVYETTGGTPTVSVSSATGPEGSSYSAAVLKRGGGASAGEDYSAWRVGRSGQRVRFRFECSSQVTSLLLRRLIIDARQGRG